MINYDMLFIIIITINIYPAIWCRYTGVHLSSPHNGFHRGRGEQANVWQVSLQCSQPSANRLDSPHKNIMFLITGLISTQFGTVETLLLHSQHIWIAATILTVSSPVLNRFGFYSKELVNSEQWILEAGKRWILLTLNLMFDDFSIFLGQCQNENITADTTLRLLSLSVLTHAYAPCVYISCFQSVNGPECK